MSEIAYDREAPALTQADKIAKARALLLEKIFSEAGNDSFVAKEAVRKLLGALQAARENGLSFESLAEVFNIAGIKLSAQTLRQYFFTVKSEVETGKFAKKQAEQLIRAKTLIANRRDEAAQKDQINAALKKFEPASQAISKSSKKSSALADDALASHGKAMHITGPASLAEKNESAIADQKEGPLLPLAKTDPAPSLSLEPVSQIRDEQRLNGELPASEAQPFVSDGQSALSLDQIEEMSLKTEVRTKLTEDLVVRNDLVMTISNKAFLGTLSKKQIHLLRTAGKLVAPTTGNSSKDFVAMKSNL